MIDESTVNSQITDSVSQVVTLLTGQSPAQSFGMLDAVLLETLGMAMHNAVTRQQHASMTSTAAVTAACAKMLQAPIPAPPLGPSPPPTVQPLPGPPTPLTPAAVVAAADVEATEAVALLQQVAKGSLAATAKQDLADIAKAAAPPPAPVSGSGDTDS
jgi:Killing trait